MHRGKPLGSSTPNYFPKPKGRKGVHNADSDVVSPIKRAAGPPSPHTRSPLVEKRSQSSIEYSTDSDDSENEHEEVVRYARSVRKSQDPRYYVKYKPECKGYTPESQECTLQTEYAQEDKDLVLIENSCSQDTKNKHSFFALFVSFKYVMLLICIIVPAFLLYPQNNHNSDLIKRCESNFNCNEQSDMCIVIKSGIIEIQEFNKPSVFLFLYTENNENKLNQIINNTITYASCVLNKHKGCSPIILNSDDLNVPTLQEDYGRVLDKYRSQLELNSIMVIRDLDKVSGHVASSLHSMCDEVSPLVQKSLFIFTIKVDDIPDKEFTFVKNMLRTKWSQLKEDNFFPLLARITSMILKIAPD